MNGTITSINHVATALILWTTMGDDTHAKQVQLALVVPFRKPLQIRHIFPLVATIYLWDFFRVPLRS